MNIRIFSIEVRISLMFTALLAFMFLFDRTGVMSVTIMAVGIHEAGHLCAMMLLKNTPRKIVMNISGVAIYRCARPCRIRDEIIISVAGPAANLAAAFVFMGIYKYVCANIMVLLCAIVMVIMAGFNLLPVSGLDGGDLLRCALCLLFPVYVAERVATIVSITVLLTLSLSGLLLFFKMPSNPTLMIVSVYLISLMLMKHRVNH